MQCDSKSPLSRETDAPETIVKLECDIDDASPEVLAYAADRLRAAGAREVHWLPLYCKKGRPGWQLQVICAREDIGRLQTIIFLETTTNGIRRQVMERVCLPRRFERVGTPWGEVSVKVATLPDGSERAAPEYEDCARLAREHDVPIQRVMQAAQSAALRFEQRGRRRLSARSYLHRSQRRHALQSHQHRPERTTMKYLIASDIHGSAYWTERLCAAIESEQPDRIVLLGDLLYHGPRNDLPRDYAPKRVIPLLNALADRIIAVRGNCDAEVDQMVLDFPVMADYATLFDETGRELFLTHGHVFGAGMHNSVDHAPALPEGSALVYGHTHVKVNEESAAHPGLWLFNPGSVSIPKDGSHSYGIYEGGAFRHVVMEEE